MKMEKTQEKKQAAAQAIIQQAVIDNVVGQGPVKQLLESRLDGPITYKATVNGKTYVLPTAEYQYWLDRVIGPY